MIPLLLALIALAPTETRPVLTPMDVFELEFATDPQIAPDASRVVYVRRFADRAKDRFRGRLWIVSADGSDHRPLTGDDREEASPRWSPDGARLAYVSSVDGDAEIHIRWMDDGTRARITALPSPPSDLAWSPDGTRLAFTMFVKEKPGEREKWLDLPQPPEGAEWAPPPKLIEDVVYRFDGRGYREPGHRHVFVVPAEGGTPEQITGGPYDHGAPAWSDDGSHLFTASNRREDREWETSDTEILAIDLATHRATPLTDRHGPDRGPAAGPHGVVAYTGFDETGMSYHQNRLYVTGPLGRPEELAADLDLPKSRPVFSRDGEHLYFQVARRGNGQVLRLDLKTGAIETVARDVGGTSLGRPYGGGSYSLADDGTIAFTHTRPDHPAEVAVIRPGEAEPRLLTRLNHDLFRQRRLGAVEERTCRSSKDGLEIHGWVMFPPDFDRSRKYPLLLEIHGGPHADYGDRFSAEMQLYAARGYVVLYTNPRGSTSYGEAFANEIHHAYPGDDYFDLMSFVDAIVAEGYVDPDRLFVTGGSGGGVLTAWIVGSTDRFRAAVVCKPVINWISFVLTADGYPGFTRHWFPGPPWEHLQHYWDRSPLARVDNVTTPTMLLTGEADHRTPISETEQFYQALKLRKVETAMVRIPEASHGIAARPSNLARKVSAILSWFARHDAGGGDRGPAGSAR